MGNRLLHLVVLAVPLSLTRGRAPVRRAHRRTLVLARVGVDAALLKTSSGASLTRVVLHLKQVVVSFDVGLQASDLPGS